MLKKYLTKYNETSKTLGTEGNSLKLMKVVSETATGSIQRGGKKADCSP